MLVSLLFSVVSADLCSCFSSLFFYYIMQWHSQETQFLNHYASKEHTATPLRMSTSDSSLLCGIYFLKRERDIQRDGTVQRGPPLIYILICDFYCQGWTALFLLGFDLSLSHFLHIIMSHRLKFHCLSSYCPPWSSFLGPLKELFLGNSIKRNQQSFDISTFPFSLSLKITCIMRSSILPECVELFNFT